MVLSACFFGRDDFPGGPWVTTERGNFFRLDMLGNIAKMKTRPPLGDWDLKTRFETSIDIASGHPAIDRYLEESYEQVRGMSSRFAAAICGHLIRRQSELAIAGDLIEIGTFEGRFFIAMALGLAVGEKGLGIDRFDWPDPGIENRFLANCAAHGLARDRFLCWKVDSREITACDLRDKLGQGAVRFIHIDSHHSRECLTNDLELVHPILHLDGIICLDDMLHPGYPMMVCAVFDYLVRHPEMRLLGVIDREDIVAASKFLVCRDDALELYKPDLLNTFSRFHFFLDADMETYFALVLTPRPRLAKIE
jgi:predicted O-methyltransferase YrrM